jgi:hypothetical protein
MEKKLDRERKGKMTGSREELAEQYFGEWALLTAIAPLACVVLVL